MINDTSRRAKATARTCAASPSLRCRCPRPRRCRRSDGKITRFSPTLRVPILTRPSVLCSTHEQPLPPRLRPPNQAADRAHPEPGPVPGARDPALDSAELDPARHGERGVVRNRSRGVGRAPGSYRSARAPDRGAHLRCPTRSGFALHLGIQARSLSRPGCGRQSTPARRDRACAKGHTPVRGAPSTPPLGGSLSRSVSSRRNMRSRRSPKLPAHHAAATDLLGGGGNQRPEAAHAQKYRFPIELPSSGKRLRHRELARNGRRESLGRGSG